MSLSFDFINKSINFFEAVNRSFKIKSPVLGWEFTQDKKKNIPPGKYVVIEPDDRDKSRLVISRKGSYEMYAIAKSDIPK